MASPLPQCPQLWHAHLPGPPLGPLALITPLSLCSPAVASRGTPRCLVHLCPRVGTVSGAGRSSQKQRDLGSAPCYCVTLGMWPPLPQCPLPSGANSGTLRGSSCGSRKVRQRAGPGGACVAPNLKREQEWPCGTVAPADSGPRSQGGRGPAGDNLLSTSSVDDKRQVGRVVGPPRRDPSALRGFEDRPPPARTSLQTGVGCRGDAFPPLPAPTQEWNRWAAPCLSFSSGGAARLSPTSALP